MSARKRLSTTIKADTHKALHHAVIDCEVEIQEAVNEALEEWLTRDSEDAQACQGCRVSARKARNPRKGTKTLVLDNIAGYECGIAILSSVSELEKSVGPEAAEWLVEVRTTLDAALSETTPEDWDKESHRGTEYAELVIWDAADEQVYLSVAAKEPQKEGDE